MFNLFNNTKNKGLLLAFVFLTIATCSLARKTEPELSRYAVGIGFEHSFYGNDLNATFRYSFKQPYTVYFGFNCFLDRKQTGHIYGDENFGLEGYRYYAKNFSKRIGIKLGAERYLKLRNPNFELYAFYDFQYNNLTKQKFDVSMLAFDKEHGLDTLIGYNYSTEGHYMLKHNLGLGIKFKLTDQVFVRGNAGFGVLVDNGPHQTGWTPEKIMVYDYLVDFQLQYNFRSDK
jgi:hypothetical protein